MKIAIRDEAHWHELRARNVGGSDIAALFGRSSFTTPWQLWQTKAGRLNMPFNEKHTRAGKFFEAGIAAWAADKWGMNIHKVEEYYTDDEAPGMGATLDYADDDGVPVEIKFTHFPREEWQFEDDVLTSVPEAYILQVQHQMACYGGDYAWLVAFVKGEPRRMKVKRSDRMIASIRQRVTDFWQSIRDDRPPPVDFSGDADAMAWMLYDTGVKDIAIDDAEELLQSYAEAHAEEKDAESRKETLRGMILSRIQEELHGVNEPMRKATVSAGSMSASLNFIDANPGKLVTADMVGTHVGGKKGYLRMTVGVKKEK